MKLDRSFCGPYLAALLSVFSLTSPAAAQAPDLDGFELTPGAVAAIELGTVFAMSPEGGLDAVELASGNVRWHSREAAKPLTLIAGRLLAQKEARAAGRLELVELAADSGQVLRSASGELPAGVVGQVVHTLGGSFETWARRDGGGVALGWEFARRPARGMAPAPSSPGPRKIAGALRFDATAGTLTEMADPFPRPPAAIELLGQERLADVPGRQFLSADRRHVLVSERVADDRVWKKYRWTLRTRDGARVGQVESFVSYAPFFVSDTLLVTVTPPYARRAGDSVEEEPLTLRAIDVRSGVEQWQHRIRDRAYRGPFPP